MENYKKIKTDFLNLGIVDIKNKFKNKDCLHILTLLNKNFSLGKNIFKTENEYLKSQSNIGVNPEAKKNNFALDVDLDFIEKNVYLKKTLTKIFGKNYKIILKKFVVQVPEKWIPAWIKRKIKQKNNNPNLNAYVLKKYQKLTYFRGVDYHMDLVEHKKEKVKFITLYIYLNKVGNSNSPLNVIEKSFKFGATKFPHNLKKHSKNKIIYNNNIFKKRILIGGIGSFYIWSCLSLHGAEKNKSDVPRISLRYKIKSKNFNSRNSLIDKLFTKIDGNDYLDKARTDVDEKNIKKGWLTQKRKVQKSLILN